MKARGCYSRRFGIGGFSKVNKVVFNPVKRDECDVPDCGRFGEHHVHIRSIVKCPTDPAFGMTSNGFQKMGTHVLTCPACSAYQAKALTDKADFFRTKSLEFFGGALDELYSTKFDTWKVPKPDPENPSPYYEENMVVFEALGKEGLTFGDLYAPVPDNSDHRFYVDEKGVFAMFCEDYAVQENLKFKNGHTIKLAMETQEATGYDITAALNDVAAMLTLTKQAWGAYVCQDHRPIVAEIVRQAELKWPKLEKAAYDAYIKDLHSEGFTMIKRTPTPWR